MKRLIRALLSIAYILALMGGSFDITMLVFSLLLLGMYVSKKLVIFMGILFVINGIIDFDLKQIIISLFIIYLWR